MSTAGHDIAQAAVAAAEARYRQLPRLTAAEAASLPDDHPFRSLVWRKTLDIPWGNGDKVVASHDGSVACSIAADADARRSERTLATVYGTVARVRKPADGLWLVTAWNDDDV